MEENSGKFVKQKLCELQYCLREPIRLCRYAGLFPVGGLTRSSITSRRCFFNFPYLMIHVASVFGQLLTTGFSVFWFFLNVFSLSTLSNLLFYMTGLITTILLLNLELNWRRMIRKAISIEINLEEIRTSKRNLWKYSMMTYVIMSLALLEHIMSIISKLSKVMFDLNEKKITNKAQEEYFSSTAPYIFNLTSYSLWKAVLFTIANVQATFLWNITDVMTICISIYLTSYFEDLNRIIKFHDDYKSMSWGKVRIFYSQLVALVKEVDSRFCYFVLLSFFTNLFFICLQLYYILNHGIPRQNSYGNNNAVHLLYYVYSLAFLITRASMMCILAANVHETAREPMFVIGHVTESEYTLEVQRFHRQLRYTTTALSGVYFYVTRSTLLNVVGTLFTYELVLLQFNIDNEDGTVESDQALYKYSNITN